MNTLEQFLKHGELGVARVGMGADELMEVLGPPEGRSTGKNPRILKYGALQLVVTRSPGGPTGLVQAVGLYFQPKEEEIPEAVRPTDWQPSGSTTEKEFRDFLKEIGYPPHSSISEEGSRHLLLDSGAKITFADSLLNAIQYGPRTNGVRQVAVSLSNDTYSALRELAKSENRAVADLCAEWLAEKAATLHSHTSEVHNAG